MGRSADRGIGIAASNIAAAPALAAAVTLAVTAALAAGCDPDLVDRRAPPATAPCQRAFGDKLGVPFVRVCPADLAGAIEAPFWIAAAPIGCTAGGHETIGCPLVLPLGPPTAGAATISPRTAQMVDAASAHRTCAMRFGGRLPTVAERAQARDALGLATVVVSASGNPTPSWRAQALAEWTTERPCADTPSTLAASCAPTRFPTEAIAEVPWPQLRSCHASPEPAAGALIVGIGEACPSPGVEGAFPRCLLALPATTRPQAFALVCQALTVEQAIHPETSVSARAAFRCVVPDGALVGTIITAP